MAIPDKRPLKVFLCHAHADRDAVRALYNRLVKDGVDAWFDKEKLLPGQDWELEIRKAVREADVVVVCLSKQFNQAGFRQKEVRLALDTAMEKPEGEIFIIPARLEECDNLESLRKWHWVDLFENDGYEILLRALKTRANNIGATLQFKKNRLSKVNNQPVIGHKYLGRTEKVYGANEEPKQMEVMPRPKRKVNARKIIVVMAQISLAITALVGIIFSFGNLFFEKQLFPKKDVSESATATLVLPDESIRQPQVFEPTQVSSTPTMTIVPTKIFTQVATSTSVSTEIMDAKGVPMILVPAGEFVMGNDNGEANEQPAHRAYLDSYYIDKYEVSNVLYGICVDEGVCEPPIPLLPNRNIYYGHDQYKDYPVVYVNWIMAKTYCEWRGGRLPTEAEWEKAARGVTGFLHPWGDSREGTWGYGNYIGTNNGMNDIYANPLDKSPYGLYNMGFNVLEWVSDFYGEFTDTETIVQNPIGPLSGKFHVIKGGDRDNFGMCSELSCRWKQDALNSSSVVGFRCTRSVQ